MFEPLKEFGSRHKSESCFEYSLVICTTIQRVTELYSRFLETLQLKLPQNAPLFTRTGGFDFARCAAQVAHVFATEHS
jgi:hypothetical protein